MKNFDQIKQERELILAAMMTAMKADDKDAFSQAFAQLVSSATEEVKAEFELSTRTADAGILAARGVGSLTSEEMKWYTDLADSLKKGDPKMALTLIDPVLPKTTVDRVFEDLEQQHPLLQMIDMVNTGPLVEFLVNTDEGSAAVWGALTDEITKEIASGFKVINLTLAKLSAFIPVPNAMLDLGPVWLERYVRIILEESIYLGLEKGIVAGDGSAGPIGMIKDVSPDAVVTGGKYPDMTPVKATSFSPKEYGALLARLTKTPNGKDRVLNNVILVCNPQDYLTKVMPATTVMVPNGGYTNNVLPYPTTIIQSAAMPEGKAVLGLARNYFMGIGTGTSDSGKLEYSDDFKFLEDKRTYRIKLYGNGMPKDHTSFVLLDISELKELVYRVEAVSAASGAAAAKV